jgi:hypothetical protein
MSATLFLTSHSMLERSTVAPKNKVKSCLVLVVSYKTQAKAASSEHIVYSLVDTSIWNTSPLGSPCRLLINVIGVPEVAIPWWHQSFGTLFELCPLLKRQEPRISAKCRAETLHPVVFTGSDVNLHVIQHVNKCSLAISKEAATLADNIFVMVEGHLIVESAAFGLKQAFGY